MVKVIFSVKERPTEVYAPKRFSVGFEFVVKTRIKKSHLIVRAALTLIPIQRDFDADWRGLGYKGGWKNVCRHLKLAALAPNLECRSTLNEMRESAPVFNSNAS